VGPLAKVTVGSEAGAGSAFVGRTNRMSAQRRTATRPSGTSAAPPRRRSQAAARPSAAPTVAPGTDRPARPTVDKSRSSQPPSRLDARTDGVRRVYRDTVAELKKINWPDRETTKNLTLVVIGISVALGILLGGIDYLLRMVFEALP